MGKHFWSRIWTLGVNLLLIISVSLLQIKTSAADANTCPYLLDGIPVSNQLLIALHEAESRYEIEILTKEINGRKHLLVLAGEHPPFEPSQVGKNLAQHFSLQGYQDEDPGSILEHSNVVQFTLNHGHKKSFSERIDDAQLPFTMGAMFQKQLLDGLTELHGSQPDLTSHLLGIFVLSNFTYIGAKAYYQTQRGAEPWFKTYFPFAADGLRNQSQTMAKNLEKGFADNLLTDQMLAVVALTYFDSMKTVLLHDYGYKIATFNLD